MKSIYTFYLFIVRVYKKMGMKYSSSNIGIKNLNIVRAVDVYAISIWAIIRSRYMEV